MWDGAKLSIMHLHHQKGFLQVMSESSNGLVQMAGFEQHLQTHISVLNLHHSLLPLPPVPVLVLPSSANGKPSTQMPMSRSLQCIGTESSGTTTPQPRPSRGSTPQCPVLITSSAQGQGPRSSHTADGKLTLGILHTTQPQLASPATPIPHILAAWTTQAREPPPIYKKAKAR